MNRPRPDARRRQLLAAAVGALSLGGARTAAAQSYPAKPIRLVVPLPPGGATDFIARALGQRVGAALGQPVLVDNKPGANQAIGVMEVVRAAPDGHSLVFCQSSVLLNPLVFSNVQYDVARDLEPVSLVCESFAYFVAPAASPASNYREFVAWAKTQKSLSYGSTGQGSSTHIYGELINLRNQLQMAHVPYRGEAPVVPDLVSGRIQCGFLSGLTTLQLVKDGKVRILASIGGSRSPATPEIPTLGELGLVNVEGWYGVFGPKGMPQPVVERIAAEFDTAIREPDIRDKMAASTLGPLGGTPADFAKAVARTLDGWTRVVKETGVRAD